jgi:hypothetical protein
MRNTPEHPIFSFSGQEILSRLLADGWLVFLEDEVEGPKQTGLVFHRKIMPHIGDFFHQARNPGVI